ncbi:MAG: S-methyl-5'-thioadenosine phosphorylase [Acidobacteria bacterium]|nr:MAG: S-methyl-5'-thioadenosine phosphorylase [Acidobacteriota bacterium]
MTRADVGIIGGSGLYQAHGFSKVEEVAVETPFGEPSDHFAIGILSGKKVAFLARHNRQHTLLPHEINYRANIFAMKKLGVKYIISASAVGSLRERYRPKHFVLPDQFIDRTRHRLDTFFGEGLAAHVEFAEPICPYLRGVLFKAGRKAGVQLHNGGTYLCMEGPQFSTKAESMMYRSWDADVIGMTNLQEAKLAREAEIAYASIAMVTDYDCWHEKEESVTVESVLAILKQNANAAIETIKLALEELDLSRENPIHSALQFAILTPQSAIPNKRKSELIPIIGKYMED